MSEKIYCMSCRFISAFKEGISGSITIENAQDLDNWLSKFKECRHPKNIESRPMLGNWYTDVCADRTALHPSVINSKNDCRWFERKTK